MVRRDLTCALWTFRPNETSVSAPTAMLCIISISLKASASKSFRISSRSSPKAWVVLINARNRWASSIARRLTFCRFALLVPIPQNIKFLKYAYDSPCDVDLGVGASMHSSDDDGNLLSDVTDRIFGIQFKNLKCGDPYFYTNALSKGSIINYTNCLINLLTSFPSGRRYRSIGIPRQLFILRHSLPHPPRPASHSALRLPHTRTKQHESRLQFFVQSWGLEADSEPKPASYTSPHRTNKGSNTIRTSSGKRSSSRSDLLNQRITSHALKTLPLRLLRPGFWSLLFRWTLIDGFSANKTLKLINVERKTFSLASLQALLLRKIHCTESADKMSLEVIKSTLEVFFCRFFAISTRRAFSILLRSCVRAKLFNSLIQFSSPKEQGEAIQVPRCFLLVLPASFCLVFLS